MPEPTSTLVAGRYRLMHVVGQGGMGVVWLARDELLDREVAVKEVLLERLAVGAARDELLQRTLREARSAARLSGPAVVTVHDIVTDAGRPWIVMELIRGRSLQQALQQDGPLPVPEAARIGVEVAGALAAAHRAGVLHRDIKPANILLEGRRVVLTDFGIATIEGATALTATGQVLGSAEYVAPERLQGRTATAACDLWALGVTLYAAVENRSPFARPDARTAVLAALSLPPDPPRLAGPLWPLLERLLDKDPETRPDAEQTGALLAALLGSATGADPTDSGTAPAGPVTAVDLVTAPAIVAGGTAVPAPDEVAPTGPAPARPTRPTRPARRRVRGAAAALGGAAVLAAALLLPRGGPDGSAGPGRHTPSATSTGAARTVTTAPRPSATPIEATQSRPPSPTRVGPGAVPKGFTAFAGVGFWLAVPSRWRILGDDRESPTWIWATTNGGGDVGTLAVDALDPTGGSALDVLKAYERDFRDGRYHRLKLSALPARGAGASRAELECMFGVSSGTFRAHHRIQAFVTADGRTYLVHARMTFDNDDSASATESAWRAAGSGLSKVFGSVRT